MTKRRSLLLLILSFAGIAVAFFVLRQSHEAGAVELPPVAHDMAAAFAPPAVPDSQLPEAVRQAQESLPRPGAALPNQTRHIGSGLGPQTVTGLVSNRVAAISVRVGDRLEPVTVTRNTFFWQALTSDVTRGDIKGLIVRWHDGRTFDVNLDFGDT